MFFGDIDFGFVPHPANFALGCYEDLIGRFQCHSLIVGSQ